MEMHAASKMFSLSLIGRLFDRITSFIFQNAPHACPFRALMSVLLDVM